MRTWQIGLLVLGLLGLASLSISIMEHAHAIRMLAESVKLLAMAQQNPNQ